MDMRVARKFMDMRVACKFMALTIWPDTCLDRSLNVTAFLDGSPNLFLRIFYQTKEKNFISGESKILK
jgi:hypothetical protein